jgi:DNA polymerase-3 subunit beta
LKLTTKRDELVSKLSIVSRAVSTRAATQALSGVLLTAAEGRVTLSATDLDLGLETALAAEVESEGSVLLPGRLLAEVARSLADASVDIETRESEHDVEIRSGSSSFHLRVLPAEDFPKLPAPAEEPGLKIPSPALEASIDLVARAASRDDMRPVLTGVYVAGSGTEMTMVATDSYRLSSRSARAGMLASISLLPNQAVFEAGSITLTTRLIEGQFPNFRQLLPESYEHDVRLPRSEFLDVTRRVSQLAQRNAPLKLSFAPGELTVAAETPDVGDAHETMPAAFEGEPLEIGFNPEFLKEGIESVEGEEILLRLISPLRPGLLQPVEGEDFRYLVMPIRLNV